jgi:Tfp pilus assembly protein PilF
MKKFVTLMVLMAVVTLGFGQKNVRQTASNYLREGKLDKAMETINQCVQDPSTAQDSKSWFIRGNIYLEIANTKDENYKKLDPNPLQQAFDSYKKSLEFDPAKDNAKKEFYEDIYKKLEWQRNTAYSQAADQYNKKQYKDAMTNWELAANAMAAIDVPDTLSIFYAAACANILKDRTKEKELYIQLLKLNYKSPAVYRSLSDVYRQEKDSANALKVAKMGQKLFPNDLLLFIAETNVYLTFNDVDKALKNLKLTIKKDTTNASAYFALGTIYDNIANDTAKKEEVREDAFNQAIVAYKSAIRLNPAYFEPNYNLGALFVNKAASINDQANKLPLDAEAEFKKLKVVAESYLAQAAPFLEKASEIQPNDLNTLFSLKQIYARTNQPDKLKAINERIDKIQKK